MKIWQENQWERSIAHVDTDQPYRGNYQMKMLENNALSSVLKMSGCGREGGSRYSFCTQGYTSMEQEYNRKELKKEDVESFVVQLSGCVKEIRKYMLNPDGLLLLPELIFVKDGTYRFCYIPLQEDGAEKTLSVSFHELTEYFIQKLDHTDTEGVFLIYKLHKETFKDSYEPEKILEEYRRERKARQQKKRKKPSVPSGSVSEGAVFYSDEKLPVKGQKEEVGIKKKKAGPMKRMIRGMSTEKWGYWEDLITEMDGQTERGPL